MITMEECSFQKMSDKNLERFLYDYSKTRKGEIADLTRAAAIRIGDLSARVKEMEREENDGK